jgi:hypothetical protein
MRFYCEDWPSILSLLIVNTRVLDEMVYTILIDCTSKEK